MTMMLAVLVGGQTMMMMGEEVLPNGSRHGCASHTQAEQEVVGQGSAPLGVRVTRTAQRLSYRLEGVRAGAAAGRTRSLRRTQRPSLRAM